MPKLLVSAELPPTPLPAGRTVAFALQQHIGANDAVRARAFLGALARSSGGKVFRPAAARELAEIYSEILDELGSQYVLGYVSDNPKQDGEYRKLKVEVSREGLKVRHRPGYDAPEPPPKS